MLLIKNCLLYVNEGSRSVCKAMRGTNMQILAIATIKSKGIFLKYSEFTKLYLKCYRPPPSTNRL